MSIKPHAIYNLKKELEQLCNFLFENTRPNKYSNNISLDKVDVAFWDLERIRDDILQNIILMVNRSNVPERTVCVNAKLADEYNLQLDVSFSHLGRRHTHEGETHKKIMLEKDRRVGSIYNQIQNCVQHHLGSIRIIDCPENSTTTYEIALPLYKLCLQ